MNKYSMSTSIGFRILIALNLLSIGEAYFGQSHVTLEDLNFIHLTEDGGYGGYSQYSSYLQSKPLNIIFLSFSFYKIVCLLSFSLPINIVILFRTRF